MGKFFIAGFLFFNIIASAQEDYKILSSSETSLVIQYEPQYIEYNVSSGNSAAYLKIDILGGSFEDYSKIGEPVLPYKIFNIGVPREHGNTINIISTSYSDKKGKILPTPDIKRKNGLPHYLYLENDEYKNHIVKELIGFDEFGLVRDLKVQKIRLNPVQFNPESNEIRLYEKIVFQVNFAPSSKKGRIESSELTKNLVMNQEVAKNWGDSRRLSKSAEIKNSVLANGNWYRFEAPEEGIYKIDRTFLSGLGIAVDDIDPRTFKIYNNGGYIVPWEIVDNFHTDLQEIAIIVEGEEDGSFDGNDQIIFYGRGVDFWEYNSSANRIKRNKHYYSKKNYFWLTYGGASGKRMELQPSLNGTAAVTQSTTPAFRFQDNDNQNLIGSGLLYVDDDFTNSSKSKTYIHMLDGLESGSTIKYSFQFINGSRVANNLRIEESGSTIYSKFLSAPTGIWRDYQYGTLRNDSAEYSGNLTDNQSALKFTFSTSSISDKGHLDYLEIEYTQNMNSSLSNIPLIFFSEFANDIIEFRGSPFNDSNFKLYNISDFKNATLVQAEYNGGGFSFKDLGSDTTSKKYLAVHNNDIKVPQNGEKIDNSNLHGFSSGAQYIIIAHPDFREQAERLKNYRSQDAPFPTTAHLVMIGDIYNEFSGGSLDPSAIRNYLRYAYENWNVKPEYVLLFGDGDFDYFNVLEKNLNFIPTFQTEESLYEIESYPYDDYYVRVAGNDKKADLGIGRLNITTLQEAKVVVDKIIEYETELDKGLWRSKITLLADDGLTTETNDGNRHTSQSETLATRYVPDYFNKNKIYLSNFQTVNTGFGRRKPDCNTALIEAINNGTLILNYIGHGNPDVWAHEIVFDRSVSIPQLRNNEYFFLTAATCDFGKFDDPNVQSASEEMILLEKAGMIGGISASRPVFSGQNAALNNQFYRYMLLERDSLGLPVPIGAAYMKLKQWGTSQNDQKFHLFADPMLRLNVPKLPVEITSVNSAGINDTVSIKALSEVSIKGRVLNSDNSTSSYAGEGIITVFDSERTIFLEDINYNMTDQGGVIFRGRVSVENGEFETGFTVPKDISYENKNGKITAYFSNNDIDGIGFTNNIVVGGTDSSNTNDGKGPEIEILYDDESESSYLVSENFKLRVKLFDETGLNTTGTGIGHKLEAILNDDEQNSIDLTDFFVGDLNSGGKSGEVNYNFSAMEPGEYKIKVNAWDVYNNFSSQEDFFTVVSENDLVVREVYNYPNPFSSNTYFTFQHNLTDPLNVKIKVYTIAGRVIKEIESFNIEDKFVKIEWNGRDDDNNKIGNGTYLYKLIVETVDGEYKENILGKMAVIR